MPMLSLLKSRGAAACVLLAGVALLSWQGRQLQQQVRWPSLQLPDQTTPASAPLPALPKLLPAPSAAAAVIAVDSLGPMQLQASLMADDPQRSRALIQLPDQGSVNLQTGEELLPGVFLQHVNTDHVVLRAGHVEQILWLRGAPDSAAIP